MDPGKQWASSSGTDTTSTIFFDFDDVPEQEDASNHGTYHFLDVGGVKYGECTLVEFGAIRILIDGSHVQDFAGQSGYEPIPEQLQGILGGEPPYDIDLVVVTHCHADHVGCLPELFSNGIIRPKYALLTDPKLGFGRTKEDDATVLDAADPGVRLAALLREEDASDLNDGQLREFMDAAVKVEPRYASFVKKLKAAGVKVMPYLGQALPAELTQLLAPTGISLLGPSQEQLLFCAEQIATTNKDAEEAADSSVLRADADILELYRSILRADADAARNPRGNGMNCQSITFAFGPPEARVLLAGDMQFAEPGVKGVAPEMAKLRERVVAAGPYKLFKTTHHTSHNGQDEEFLESIGNPELIVHSGGLHDSAHPFPAVLQMLKGQHILFARTDRNGGITVKPHLPAAKAITVSRGRLNDFTPNKTRDDIPESAVMPVAVEAGAREMGGAGPQIIIVNLPNAPIDLVVAGVDIRVRSLDKARGTAVEPSPRPSSSISAVFSPQPQQSQSKPSGDFSFGRSLGNLLFVTDGDRLRGNVGKSAAESAFDAIQKAGGTLCDAPGEKVLNTTRQALRRNPAVKGVILLGGYDVVPSTRTDALGTELRGVLGARVRADHDKFWVWSDRLYGDSDGDSVAEIPVSRVPDAGDSDLFLSALAASPFIPAERFGVRNIVREFAQHIWPSSMGARQIKVCSPFLSSHVQAPDLDAACHYFMLHGVDDDARAYSGEDLNGGYPVAFTIGNVPAKFRGVVFSGCCWGALIVDGKASEAGESMPPSRPAQASIALSYLKAGAVAYIGCTGSHYSGPDIDANTNYAARLHSAFWSALAQPGCAPAVAIFQAKLEYLRWIVAQGSQLDPLDTARRLKNVSQFTCLGLGW
jgi:beta-lactamase superfamily II metal-dependent hydrolase